MARKIADLVVKTGEYQNGQGETKGRYENVGSMMEGDNGNFMILKRTFNPAGVPNPDCKDSVIVSCFEPQQAQGQQNNQAPRQQPQQNQGAQYQQPQQAPRQQGGYQGKPDDIPGWD